jgi:hypothetical protein
MASTITLTQLVDRVLDRADLTDSDFPVSARVRDYINDAMAELYDIMTVAYEDYFVSTSDISLVADTESYNLPSDFFKALKVFYKSGDNRYLVRRFNLNEITNTNMSPILPFMGDESGIRYRIMANKIYFTPTPNSSGTVELWYIPELTKFATDGSEDSDAITFKAPAQWEEFVVVSAAIRLLDREESDTTALKGAKMELKQGIINTSTTRDTGEPMRITRHNNRFARRWRI